MATELTEQQRDEIAANPHQAVPVVDATSGKTYFVVDEEFLLHDGYDEPTRERLRALIQQGIEAPHVSREEGDARIRAKISQLAENAE